MTSRIGHSSSDAESKGCEFDPCIWWIIFHFLVMQELFVNPTKYCRTRHCIHRPHPRRSKRRASLPTTANSAIYSIDKSFSLAVRMGQNYCRSIILFTVPNEDLCILQNKNKEMRVICFKSYFYSNCILVNLITYIQSIFSVQ